MHSGKIANSRRTAAFIVARWLAEGAFPSELLPDGGADRAFIQDAVYTVVRRLRPLKFAIGRLMDRWPKGELEALLYVGAAQILYMDSVPDYAAVNETVEAAKASGGRKRLDGVVNGVLRSLLRRKAEIAAEIAKSPLALRESYPDWLAARWVARYGAEKAEKLAKWHNEPAETFLAYPDGRYEKLPRGEKVQEREGFAKGAFMVQDPATKAVVDLLDVKPGMRVLDFCAAPGGKTIQIAWRMKGEGRLVAQEVKPKRLRRLKENLSRMGMEWVETVPSLEIPAQGGGTFERVLVDAPCSNSGVIRRRPDVRWRLDAGHLAEAVKLQGSILARAAGFVAPGGLLVYATCSNEPEENGLRIDDFLASPEGARFREVGRHESLPVDTGFDGAFACALKAEES